MKIEIVKVQLPLYSSGSADDALIYAEGRKNMQTRPLTAHERKLIGADVKAFFRARWSPTQANWTLLERTSPKPW